MKIKTAKSGRPNSGREKRIHKKSIQVQTKKKKSAQAKHDKQYDDEIEELENEDYEEKEDITSSESESDDGSDSDSDSGSNDSSDDDGDDNDENEKGAFFTDENAAWLKPKKKQSPKKSQLLMSDDEDDEENDDEFDGGSSGSDDDDEELLEVERQARIVDAEMEAEREEAEMEMQRTINQNTSIFHLPTPEELEQDENRVVPPSEIRSRIDSILEVLADFKSRREDGRARSEYIDQLVSDVAELYGYLPELIEYFISMFGPAETLEFVDASDKPRPLVVRTNTLKTRRKDLAAALMKRGVTLDPLANWSKVGLKIIESPVPVGATPEYLSGQYMLQSAASMCPVMALSPQPSERVLDVASAPGGKTSYIAQLMRNTGVIVANDLRSDRQKATAANMHRLGVRNVITCTHDGRKLGKKFKNHFDRILLDAPCSGLGVISRDPSVKVQRTMEDIRRTVHLQKELLLNAIDALNHKSKTGGIMVYSTCSVSVAENEEVVNYALSKRDIKIIDTGLDFGKPGFTRYQQKRFHPSVALTRRFYPHVHNMDGFYVTKIQKLSDLRPEDTVDKSEETKDDSGSDADEVSESHKKEAKSDASGKGRKRGKNKGKKRKGEDNDDDSKKAKKSRDVSKPPRPNSSDQKAKKKTNAKVTKPRRQKKQDQNDDS